MTALKKGQRSFFLTLQCMRLSICHDLGCSKNRPQFHHQDHVSKKEGSQSCWFFYILRCLKFHHQKPQNYAFSGLVGSPWICSLHERKQLNLGWAGILLSFHLFLACMGCVIFWVAALIFNWISWVIEPPPPTLAVWAAAWSLLTFICQKSVNLWSIYSQLENVMK